MIITTFGLALRLYYLDYQCIATDENATLKIVLFDPVTIILWTLGGDYNPPLYYLFAHYSTVFFNSVTTFTIRFPAAIFGTLCIPASYFLGTEFKNKTLGMLMASSISFLYPLIYYSQDGRAYTLVMLAFIGYIYFYIKVYRGDTRYPIIICASICAMLCLWSHFYSIIPLIISLFILAPKYKRTALFGSALVILMCLPFFRYIVVVINHFRAIPTFVRADWGWLGPIDIAITIPWVLFGWMGILMIPLTLLTLWKYRDTLHTILIAIATITALSCIPMTELTAMSPRYTLLVSPIVLLVALYPISEFIDCQNTTTKKSALFVGIIFLLFLFNYQSLDLWYTVNICPRVNLSLSPWM